jgi:acylphosphatase
MKKRVHVWIYGKVKNVFFRGNIKDKADSLGLKGFVRNNEDNVEAVFEGDNKKIEEMLVYCKEGPKYAQVEKIETKDETYSAEFKDFQILHF